MLNASLKNSFLQWYIKEYGVSLKSKAEDFNITSHMQEFRGFLTDELGFSSNSETISLSEIMALDLSSGFSVADDEANNINMNNILAEFMQDEQMISLIDGNLDSKLDNDEIFAFLDMARRNDGNYTDISLDDLLLGFEALQDAGEEIIPEGNKETINRNSSSSSSSKNAKKKSSDIKTMSDGDLNAEIQKRQKDFSLKQTNYNNLMTGKNASLAELKEKMDYDYDLYSKQLYLVDNELASQLTNSVNKVENQQNILDESELKYTNQQILVSNLTFQYDNTQLKLNSLLQVQIELNSADTTQMSVDEVNDIQSKKENTQLQISQVEKELEQINLQKEQANADLITYEQEKNQNKTLLDEVKMQNDELEQNIAAQKPEIKTYYDNYLASKNAYYEFKASQSENAKTELIESNDSVNEAQKIQEERKIEDEIKALSPSLLSQYDEEWGKIISEAAKKYAKEGHSTSCGASVRKVLESLGYDYINRCKGKEWAEQNMENSPDFVEVDFSLEDIKAGNVPVGSVVCFSEYDSFGYGDGNSGHVAIVIDNNGKICEASGYIREEGINTNIIELGSGSVRIFVPTKRPD